MAVLIRSINTFIQPLIISKARRECGKECGYSIRECGESVAILFESVARVCGYFIAILFYRYSIIDLHSIILGVLALELTGPTRKRTKTSYATTTFAGDAATSITADGSGSTVYDSTMGFASQYATG